MNLFGTLNHQLSILLAKPNINNFYTYRLSSGQNWDLVEKKLRYPLPRQMFREGVLSVRMNKNENIGNPKFNVTMNLAKTWKSQNCLHSRSCTVFPPLRSFHPWIVAAAWCKSYLSFHYMKWILYILQIQKRIISLETIRLLFTEILTIGLRLNRIRKSSWKRQM